VDDLWIRTVEEYWLTNIVDYVNIIGRYLMIATNNQPYRNTIMNDEHNDTESESYRILRQNMEYSEYSATKARERDLDRYVSNQRRTIEKLREREVVLNDTITHLRSRGKDWDIRELRYAKAIDGNITYIIGVTLGLVVLVCLSAALAYKLYGG